MFVNPLASCRRGVLASTGNVARCMGLVKSNYLEMKQFTSRLHSLTSFSVRKQASGCILARTVLQLEYLVSTNRTYAQAKRKSQDLVEAAERGSSAVTVGEKVKQAGKDATYTAVVLVGLGVTGIMAYAVGRELFSGDSSTGVYTKAYKMCKNNTQVTDVLGTPLKGYGETNRRGRRRHVSHAEYLIDDVKHMRMKFYIEGPLGKGNVHLEVKQNEKGKYEHRYLFVQLEEWPHRTIVIEDNR